jgi:hypothetical protein
MHFFQKILRVFGHAVVTPFFNDSFTADLESKP